MICRLVELSWVTSRLWVSLAVVKLHEIVKAQTINYITLPTWDPPHSQSNLPTVSKQIDESYREWNIGIQYYVTYCIRCNWFLQRTSIKFESRPPSASAASILISRTRASGPGNFSLTKFTWAIPCWTYNGVILVVTLKKTAVEAMCDPVGCETQHKANCSHFECWSVPADHPRNRDRNTGGGNTGN